MARLLNELDAVLYVQYNGTYFRSRLKAHCGTVRSLLGRETLLYIPAF